MARPTETSTQTPASPGNPPFAGEAEADVVGGAVGRVPASGTDPIPGAVRVVAQVRPTTHHSGRTCGWAGVGVTLVGDPWQSRYEFSGSEPKQVESLIERGGFEHHEVLGRAPA